MKCFDMKKLLKSSQATLMMILAGIAIVSASSYSIDEAMAFPHASLVIDPEEEHANDIRIVLGHTSEPAYGKLPGIHDGKHNLEVDLSDDATTLPIANATLTADKFYFADLESFEQATSPFQADEVERAVPVTAVFGQAGTFYNRQVIEPGIYGYHIKGVINYYDVADVPVDVTKFCNIAGENAPEDVLTKFDFPRPNSDPNYPFDWQGSFGCPINIEDIFFPENGVEPLGSSSETSSNSGVENGKDAQSNDPQYLQSDDDGDDRYGYESNYGQDNFYNDYSYVNEDDYSQNSNNNYGETKDDKKDKDKGKDRDKDDRKDKDKGKDKGKDRDNGKDNYKKYYNDNYDEQYGYEYINNNGEYGNEYTSYEKENKY